MKDSLMEKTKIEAPNTFRFVRNVLLKSLVLFGLCNFVYMVSAPIDLIGRISAYNILFPGRQRLPFGERPDLAYNLTLDNLPAMLAAHEIDGIDKEIDEFRIIMIGDSSVWGYLLPADETISAQINQANIRLEDGRRVRAFNLGYPTLSVTKDLFILSNALRYQPDLILWFVTLESMPWEKQLASPILRNNFDDISRFMLEWQLPIEINDPSLVLPSRWETSIIGQRRLLADWFRLQIYGILWAATGIDQVYPETIEPPQWDLPADELFYGMSPAEFDSTDLAFSVLDAGIKKIGTSKVFLVNEPIFISAGKNSELRYNFYYPRWAYNAYRKMMHSESQRNGWLYLDFWDRIPVQEFTNSAIHLSQNGTKLLAHELIQNILRGIR